jgi:hypothetical protein
LKKNDLHELIHSMSKSEKRYFKLQCGRQAAEGNYLRVFEILEKQLYFDEKGLREKLAGASFLAQLHVTKNYLREKIMESLRSFHSQMSKDAAVKDLLKNVEILFYKELYEQALEELNRAQVLAKEFELFTAQIEISRWKRKLEQTLHPNNYEHFSSILKEQQVALEALQNIFGFWKGIVQTAQRFMQRGIEESRNVLSDIPEKAKSLESKTLFFNTLYIKLLREGRQAAAGQALIDLIQYLETQPHRVKDDPVPYITTINNLASFYVFRDESEAALRVISMHRSFLSKLALPDSRRPVLKQIVRTTNIELEIFRNAADPAKHESFYQGAEVFVKQLAPKMPPEYLLSFQFQFAWVCFLKKDYNQALTWVSEPINSWRKNNQFQVFRYVLLLNLMIHCEHRNLFVLRYFVENSRRYFKKMGGFQAFETELLHFFIKIGESPKMEYPSLYRGLKARLFPESGVSMVPEEALRMMDFRRWLT